MLQGADPRATACLWWLPQGGFYSPRIPETPLFILIGSLQVASILEPNFSQMEEARFSLPPEVLSALPSEAVALAFSLLENCGLELQGPGCQLSWDPAAVPQVSALHGCLEGLQLLAGSSQGPLPASV